LDSPTHTRQPSQTARPRRPSSSTAFNTSRSKDSPRPEQRLCLLTGWDF
jgi:hypothetical protein